MGEVIANAGIMPQCWREGEQALRHDATTKRDQAFAGLVARHSRMMFRVAYSLLRNTHDAEDAVQEAFLKLYRGEAWRSMEDEKAFLARTVWRVAFNRLPVPGRAMEDAGEMSFVCENASPEENAIGGDERALLRTLISALPEELRHALVLSAVEEMSSREMAAVLGIPEGTVRTRVMRAKAELRKRFQAMQGGR